MNANSRNARQIIKTRRAEAAQDKRPHTLASHALRAGVVEKDAAGVAGALRSKGKKTGVTGCAVRMFRKNSAGQKMWRKPVEGARRYTKGEFLTLATAYNPRAERFVAARQLMLSY
jgi:hypothetical protein